MEPVRRQSGIGVAICLLTWCLSGCSLYTSSANRPCRGKCLELDHIYIFVSRDAPERERLIELGLRAPNHVARHTAQGTASVGFIFENVYLELIWVADDDEFRATCAAHGEDFCDQANWRETGASPFGLGLRNRCGRPHPPSLPHHEHHAEWMEPGTFIYDIDNSSPAREPQYFVVPPYMALPAWVTKVDTTNALGARRLTGAEVKVRASGGRSHAVSDFGVGSGFNFVSATPAKRLSRAARLLKRTSVVEIDPGPSPLLILTFDHGNQRRSADLRPELPLVIAY